MLSEPLDFYEQLKEVNYKQDGFLGSQFIFTRKLVEYSHYVSYHYVIRLNNSQGKQVILRCTCATQDNILPKQHELLSLSSLRITNKLLNNPSVYIFIYNPIHFFRFWFPLQIGGDFVYD